jgi:hypothetical protein
MIWLAGVLMEYTCPNAKIQFLLEQLEMYYFGIEAHDGVGYTLAALRCGKKLFENLALSNWYLVFGKIKPKTV